MRAQITALFLAALFGLAAAAPPAVAEPVPYTLQPDLSSVGYEVDFGPDLITGTMPVATADLRIDFTAPPRSTVNVTIDARGARASFPFAAQALRGPRVLDARRFPEIRFVSTAVRVIADGVAEVEGDLTIRDTTRPVTLRAELYRQRGTEAGDLDRLSLLLTGTVSRAAFGATGWAEDVGDAVRLRILARIVRTE